MTEPAITEETRQAIESILMVADQPVEPTVLAQLLEVPKASIEAACTSLAEEYEQAGRGFILARVAGGYRFQSHPDLAAYVERFVLDGQSSRLSAAALETLAIIAYKQPISRVQIAAIRGVNVDGVLRTLQQRGYVDEVSRDPGPGNAVLFGTTPLFLERVGLDSLEDLPALADFVPGADVVEALEEGLRPDPLPDVEASEAGDSEGSSDTAESVADDPAEPTEGSVTGDDVAADSEVEASTPPEGSVTAEAAAVEELANAEADVDATPAEDVESGDVGDGGADDVGVSAEAVTEEVDSGDVGDVDLADDHPEDDHPDDDHPDDDVIDLDAVEREVVEEIVVDLTVEPDSDSDPDLDSVAVGDARAAGDVSTSADATEAVPTPSPPPPAPMAYSDATATVRHDPADTAEPTVPFRPTPGNGGAAGPATSDVAMGEGPVPTPTTPVIHEQRPDPTDADR